MHKHYLVENKLAMHFGAIRGSMNKDCILDNTINVVLIF